MTSRYAGIFVTFEGIDGSGKSTQIHMLTEKLRSAGMDFIRTREPGGTDLAEAVRSWLLTPNHTIALEAELFLFLAARAQHVAEVIRPALAVGKVVVCERFSDSTYAYQVGGRQLSASEVSQLNAVAVRGLEPDLTFFLDTPDGLGRERIEKARRQGDRIESEDQAFFSRVSRAYRDVAAAHPGRVITLEAEKTAEVLAATIWSEVEKRWQKRQEMVRHDI
jgi:dTMP kinase